MFKQYTKLAALMGFTLLSAAAFSADQATISDKIPDFMQQNMNQKSSQESSCPEGMVQNWRILWSPTSGVPLAPSTGLTGTRAFSAVPAINQTLTHSFDLKPLNEKCCRVKEAWLYVNSNHVEPPNPWTGNAFTGGVGADIFAFFPPGSPIITAPAAPFSNAIHPNWAWNAIPVPASFLPAGVVSYAIGDDTNVKQTAILAKTCCLEPLTRSGNQNSTAKSSSSSAVKTFLQMMEQDKGKGEPKGKGAELANPEPAAPDALVAPAPIRK